MDFNRFILRLRLYKLDDCPVEATMMLHELVPDSSMERIVVGTLGLKMMVSVTTLGLNLPVNKMRTLKVHT